MKNRGPGKDMRISFKARMLLAFSLLLLTLIGANIFIEVFGIPFTPIKGEFRIQKEEAQKNLTILADLKKKHALQWIGERRGDAEILSESEILKFSVSSLVGTIRQIEKEGGRGDALWDAVREKPMYRSIIMHLKQMVSSHDVYESVRIVDPAADRIIASSSDNELGLSYTKSEDFTEPLDTDQRGTATGYHFHEGTFHLDISRPIKPPDPVGGGNGAGACIIHIHVSTDGLIGVIIGGLEELGETGEATLINEKGILMSPLKHRFPDGSTPRLFVQRVKAMPAAQAASGNEGSMETKDYRGETVIAVYRHIPLTNNLGWGLVVKQDVSEILSPLRKEILFHLVFAVFGFLLVLGLAYFLAQKLFRPIDALTAAAAEVGRGNMDARAPVATPDEIGFLADTFNSMVEKIQGWQRELEENVRSRTAELAESEEKYRNLVDNALVGVFQSNLAGKIEYVNEALIAFTGHESREELLQMGSPAQYSNPDDREKLIDTLKREGSVTNYEVELVTKTGQPRTALISATLQGETISGMILDITVSRRATEALRESEERFRDLVANAVTGILIVQGGQIVFRNPELARMLGHFDTPMNLSALKALHGRDDEQLHAIVERVESGTQKTVEQELRYHNPGKRGERLETGWLYCRAIAIEYRGQRATLVNMMDITRAKELEMVMKDRVTSLGRVAAGIAHEIRNPLSGINVYLTTLRRIIGGCGAHDEAEEIIAQVQSASNKIESVVRRALDFSKPGETRFALTDVNALVDEALNLSSVSLRSSGIEVERELSPDLPKCYADPHQFEQVILNLISNAAEALRNHTEPRKVKVSTRAENNTILLTVSDSGPGVPEEIVDRVFEPFFSTKTENSGLGLSITNRIITDHGGQIDIGKSEWGGAEFALVIPVERRKRPR